MKKFVWSRMVVSLPLAMLTAIVLIFISEVSFRESIDAQARIEMAQQSRNTLGKVVQLVLDAETGQRGYLLTGEKSYLEPYTAATLALGKKVAALRIFFASNENQQTDFAVMSRHIAGKLAEMDLTVRSRKNGNEAAWKFVITTDVGQEHMEIIRQQADKLDAASIRDIEDGQTQIKQTLQLARLGVAIMALAGLLAFCLYLIQTRALFDSGTREKQALQLERDDLDLQVRERTANLAQLATHLQNVREDERAHLARELHDELGSLLTAAKLDVARVKSRLGNNMPEAAERLTHLTDTLNNGIALKRRIVEDLRPSSLSHLGLVASLEILAREFEQRSGLAISTDLKPVKLDDSAQLTVYRLVQESLTNIGKYAEATQAVISLHNDTGFVSVEVNDNGKGFDTAKISTASQGLAGMRHRVEATGGRLTVRSAGGAGTRISAVLPQLG
jgi:signal transduction histidine kinase